MQLSRVLQRGVSGNASVKVRQAAAVALGKMGPSCQRRRARANKSAGMTSGSLHGAPLRAIPYARGGLRADWGSSTNCSFPPS